MSSGQSLTAIVIRSREPARVYKQQAALAEPLLCGFFYAPFQTGTH